MDQRLDRKIWLIATALALLAACDDSKPKGVVYTLYRNSPTVVGTISGLDARSREQRQASACQILLNQRGMLEAGVYEQKIAALEEAVAASSVLPFKRRA